MISSNLSRSIFGAGFIAAVLFTYRAFLEGGMVAELSSNKQLAESGLSEEWKNGNVILLIRHEERCDLSGSPCLGPDDGITLSGGERAKEAGVRIKSYFGLSNSDIFTDSATSSIQTSDIMLGNSSPLPSREDICGVDIISRLLKFKVANKNIIVVTDKVCVIDLIKYSGKRKSKNLEYGSLLFAKVSRYNRLEIIGILKSDDIPK
ncbi:histidine phosphatase family protein [Pseudomonas tolaasii]|uniref:histidine phosphatase family protein n=1 Tax=Pseudomonas tolaasii TaxID=29442 RepID=UPI001C52CF23|nr:histidine phosphatase family protein [Pseudomonas tolaasii]QXQ20666.1 histidine phosphatase family protein [Pseudomonas tolaasii]